MFRTAFILGILSVAHSYSIYQDRIPNGKSVPHPCKPNYIWKGVGHENVLGGGIRNPFGMDFAANGHRWDECLCETDSDGDGKTNGEELGDPFCNWKPGAAPLITLGLSHPGVCEPMDSYHCMQRNWDVDCSIPEFNCEAVGDDPDSKEYVIRLDETPVPAEETTYICQAFRLPNDTDYDIIATEPYIANENVAHHIILYGCSEDNAAELWNQFGKPVQCGMNTYLCGGMLGGWTVGSNGNCLRDNLGVRFGQANKITHAVLEIHWNNPMERDDYVDSSGLILHYTPNLRQYELATMFIGPAYLELPPGQKEVIQEGHCPTECTEKIFKETIYIPSITPHMHYLGRGMIVEHIRNGRVLRRLVDMHDYSYDSPQTISIDPPVEFLPGDELNVTCIFETTNQRDFVFFGEETSDEMCLAITDFYPRQNNLTGCLAINGVGFCGGYVGGMEAVNCYSSYDEFFTDDFTALRETLDGACDPYGWECWSGCREAIAEVRRHECLKDNLDHIILRAITSAEVVPNDFILMMASCDERLVYPDESDDDDDVGSEQSSLCSGPPVSVATDVAPPQFLCVMFIAFLMLFY